MSSRRRIAFCTSLSEVMTAAALLETRPAGDSVIGVYGASMSVGPALVAACRAHSRLFLDAADVIDCTDLQAPESAPAVAAFQDAIRERFGTAPAEILISSIGAPLARAICRSWPDSPIVLFDNGLVSHAELPEDADDGPFPMARSVIAPDMTARVRLFSSTLLPLLPPPASLGPVVAHALPLDALRVVIRRARRRAPTPLPAPTGVGQLLLGTSFFRTKLISEAAEMGLYEAAADRAAAEGRRCAFKPHHRGAGARPPILASALELADLPLPVELLFSEAPPEACCSISSTALLTMSLLYGVPPTALRSDATTALRRLPAPKLLDQAMAILAADAPQAMCG